MKSHAFEIRVAFVGNTNTGKSTLIDALLQGKYSEVALGGATKGVNAFRIFTKKDHLQLSNENSELGKDVCHEEEEFDYDGESTSCKTTKTEDISQEEAATWSIGPDDLQSMDQVYQAISNANATLRQAEEIHETVFDIELPETVCDMRNDTKLVLVDIPGWNTPGKNDMYLNYVNSKWDSFDCVVVVLDVFQDDDEQELLLNLVNYNIANEKDIPVIVVCNKVDDPYNQDAAMLVEKYQIIASEVFGPACKTSSISNF
jgi:GTP-binding protein EngB required for normal cell division